MAQLEVLSPGAFASLRVELEGGERFISESSLMVRASSNVDIDVTTRPRGKGGLMSGLKRMLGGDSFFMSTYEAEGAPGEVVLAPVLPGDIHVMNLDGTSRWVCAGASYMASGPHVSLDTQFQGLKGFFSGESLVFMEVGGRGPVAVNAFGRISEVQVDGGFVVDTGHVVAFETSLSYSLSKAGGSWISSWLAGEGIVLEFSGQGRLLMQSHNPTEFGRALGPMLPPR